jgi:CBS domain-containing protein
VNDKGVVLGRLGREALDADPETVVEAVMEPGPTTIRPNLPLESILKRMRGKMESRVVTTSDGELVGILYRKDVKPLHGIKKSA